MFPKYNDASAGVALVIGGLLLLVICWYFQSYMEAEAYYRVTGKRVTVLDAMFLDLRVQAEPKEKP